MSAPLAIKVLFLEEIVLPSFGVRPVLDHEARIEWVRGRVQGRYNGVFDAVYLEELFTSFGTSDNLDEIKQKFRQLKFQFEILKLREMINDIRESQLRVLKLDEKREEREREREREEEREEKERKDREKEDRENAEWNLAMRNWVLSFFFLTSPTPSNTPSNTTAISHSPSSVLLPPSKSPILQKTSFSSSSSLTTEENIDQEDTLDQNNLKDQEISQLRRRKLVK